MASHSDSHEHSVNYLLILGVLLLLTVITVAVSRVDMGSLNLIVAMIVASIKAGIVGMFFMHLKFENKLIWLYVAIPLLLLVVMMIGVFIDSPLRTDPPFLGHQQLAF